MMAQPETSHPSTCTYLLLCRTFFLLNHVALVRERPLLVEQDLFLAGKRDEAAAALPDALIDETSLVGPKERIRDRLQAWKTIAKEHKVGTLLLGGVTIDSARVAAEAVL